MNPTNGVQILWFWIVAALAAAAPDKATLLTMTQSACAVLNVAAFAPLWGVARRLGRPWIAAFLAVCWTCATLTDYLSAMENSLNAVVFWTALWLVLRAVDRRNAGAAPSLLAPFAALSVLVWTRVDHALFAAAFGALLAIDQLRRFGWTAGVRRSLASAGVVAAVAASCMLAGYRLMDETLLPVSGRIKMDSYGWSAAYFLDLLRIGFERVLAPLAAVERFAPPAWRTGATWLCITGALAVFAAAIVRRKRATHRNALGQRAVLMVLGAAVLAHTAFLAGLREYAIYGRWYSSPLLIAIATGLAVGGEAIARLGRGRWAWGRLCGVAGLLAMAGGGWVRQQWAEASGSRYRNYYQYAMLCSARWLAASTPADARCAAWNAGIVSYFSDRAVTNLDGLANSAAYYRTVLRGDVGYREYFAISGVEIVVDFDTTIPTDVRGASTLLAAFEIPGDREGRRFEIRRLRGAPAELQIANCQ